MWVCGGGWVFLSVGGWVCGWVCLWVGRYVGVCVWFIYNEAAIACSHVRMVMIMLIYIYIYIGYLSIILCKMYALCWARTEEHPVGGGDVLEVDHLRHRPHLFT